MQRSQIGFVPSKTAVSEQKLLLEAKNLEPPAAHQKQGRKNRSRLARKLVFPSFGGVGGGSQLFSLPSGGLGWVSHSLGDNCLLRQMENLREFLHLRVAHSIWFEAHGFTVQINGGTLRQHINLVERIHDIRAFGKDTVLFP